MSKKVWIIFAAAVVILLVGLVYLSNKTKIDVSQVDANSVLAASEQSGSIADRVFGKADSKVVLVEYGDFQCPGCGSVYPTLKALSEKYEGQIAFVFRNFPLSTIHPNARAAASAAEAAGQQGKYWEMHDYLYEQQSSWENMSSTERTNFFTAAATQLGLKLDTFTTDLTSPAVAQKIGFDVALGKKAGITGTPGLTLNGETIGQDIWSDQAKFDTALVEQMKKHNIELPKTDK